MVIKDLLAALCCCIFNDMHDAKKPLTKKVQVRYHRINKKTQYQEMTLKNISFGEEEE